MTPKQSSFLTRLVLLNLIVYAALGLYFFGPSLAPLLAPYLARLTPVAFRPTRTRTPTVQPSATRAPTRVLAAAKPRATSAAPRAPVSAPAPDPVQDGASPQDPMIPADAWRTLGGGSKVWYMIGSGGVHMDVFLEVKPIESVAMDVYAPNQLEQPIGSGTVDKSGRLAWAGGHWQSEGNWLALVTNKGPAGLQYKLTSAIHDISHKSCYSYWEYIGTSRVYWTKCE
ncbi:MAG: hypothetical protein M1482_18225 [Chloroflexi bacterium]|nr:hypothetical protein [Chloroflexota bacterium]